MSDNKQENHQDTENQELSLIKKVELMNSLVTLIKDQEFINLIKTKDNGELMYKVFMDAATSEIEKLMGNKKEDIEDVNTIKTASRELQGVMDFFMNSKLIELLVILSKNMEAQEVAVRRPVQQQQTKNTQEPNNKTSKRPAQLLGIY